MFHRIQSNQALGKRAHATLRPTLVASLLCATVACSSSATPPPLLAPPPETREAAPLPEPTTTVAPAPEPTTTAEERDLETIATLKHAQAQYDEFLRRAGDDPAFAEAVARAENRIADLEATISFLEQGIAERRLEAQQRDR